MTYNYITRVTGPTYECSHYVPTPGGIAGTQVKHVPKCQGYWPNQPAGLAHDDGLVLALAEHVCGIFERADAAEEVGHAGAVKVIEQRPGHADAPRPKEHVLVDGRPQVFVRELAGAENGVGAEEAEVVGACKGSYT